MTNEFGEKLDRNGYAGSILEGHDQYHCYLCGRNGCGQMDRHELFGGSYREKSKRLGLWVHLCHDRCHLNGVHARPDLMQRLHEDGQQAAMDIYGWSVDEFRQEFGKNYREDEA